VYFSAQSTASLHNSHDIDLLPESSHSTITSIPLHRTSRRTRRWHFFLLVRKQPYPIWPHTQTRASSPHTLSTIHTNTFTPTSTPPGKSEYNTHTHTHTQRNKIWQPYLIPCHDSRAQDTGLRRITMSTWHLSITEVYQWNTAPWRDDIFSAGIKICSFYVSPDSVIMLTRYCQWSLNTVQSTWDLQVVISLRKLYLISPKRCIRCRSPYCVSHPIVYLCTFNAVTGCHILMFSFTLHSCVALCGNLVQWLCYGRQQLFSILFRSRTPFDFGK
jgi:hypothetical protein